MTVHVAHCDCPPDVAKPEAGMCWRCHKLINPEPVDAGRAVDRPHLERGGFSEVGSSPDTAYCELVRDAQPSSRPASAIAAVALRQHAEVGRVLDEGTPDEIIETVERAYEEMWHLLGTFGMGRRSVSVDEDVELAVDAARERAA